nr:MAG TPA: hypothetical protein [Caudoviricetes sp.]
MQKGGSFPDPPIGCLDDGTGQEFLAGIVPAGQSEHLNGVFLTSAVHLGHNVHESSHERLGTGNVPGAVLGNDKELVIVLVFALLIVDAQLDPEIRLNNHVLQTGSFIQAGAAGGVLTGDTFLCRQFLAGLNDSYRITFHFSFLLLVFGCVGFAGFCGLFGHQFGVGDEISLGHTVQSLSNLHVYHGDYFQFLGFHDGTCSLDDGFIVLVGPGESDIHVQDFTCHDVRYHEGSFGGGNGASNHRFAHCCFSFRLWRDFSTLCGFEPHNDLKCHIGGGPPTPLLYHTWEKKSSREMK